MRTSIEVMRDILDNCEGTEGPDEVRANTFIRTNLGEIQKCMQEYAKEVVDDILEDPSMIYYDGAEAVYSYEAFEKYKEQL